MLIGNGIETFVYADDAGRFAINVRHLGVTSDARQVYAYHIYADGASLTSGADITSGVGATPNARDAMCTLLAFITSDAESYSYHMGRSQPDDGYLFGERVAEWAYGMSSELSMIECELEEPTV